MLVGGEQLDRMPGSLLGGGGELFSKPKFSLRIR